MKAFKYKLRPSKSVAEKFVATLDICCELYNASIQERRDSYRATGKGVGFAAQSRQLPEIKADRDDVATVYSQVLVDVLRRSDRASAINILALGQRAQASSVALAALA
jgi:putative transposase